MSIVTIHHSRIFKVERAILELAVLERAVLYGVIMHVAGGLMNY